MKTQIPIDLTALRGFHEDLRVVLSAGLPIGLGPAITTAKEVKQFLNELEDRAAAIVNHQADEEPQLIASLIQNDSAIPVEYRGALLAWVGTQGSPLAIEPLVVRVEAARREQTHRFISSITPFVWCAVGMSALFFLCWTFFPAVVAFAESIEHSSASVSVVSWLANHISLWIWVLPAAFVGLWLLWWLTQVKSTRHGESDFQVARIRAAEAERAAELAEHQPSIEPFLAQEFELQPRQTLPPLVAWAIEEAELPGGLPVDGSLRVAGRLYRSLANLQSEALQSLTPSKKTLLFGGLLALLVALTVFLPLIDLLLAVATGGNHS